MDSLRRPVPINHVCVPDTGVPAVLNVPPDPQNAGLKPGLYKGLLETYPRKKTAETPTRRPAPRLADSLRRSSSDRTHVEKNSNVRNYESRLQAGHPQTAARWVPPPRFCVSVDSKGDEVLCF